MTAIPCTRRKAKNRQAIADNRAGYLFIAPWLFGFFVFTLFPMLASLYLAFTKYDGFGAPEFIGLENFRTMFSDPVFYTSLAKSGSTFLCRFGTSRFTVWLSQLVSLILCMIGFLLGTLILSIANNYLILALSRHNGNFSILCGYDYAFLPETYLSATLRQSLESFPRSLLDVLEILCLMYLFACCLWRNKWVTLAVVILGPLLLWVMTLAPVFRQAIDLVQYGSESEMILQGLQWINWLQKAWNFFTDHWRLIQGLAALVSLPLSYLCVRSTPQP